MTNVLDGVAQLLRVEVGEFPAELTDLNELVDGIAADTTLGEEGLVVRRVGELPPVICRRQLVAEVFRNLVENGIKYGGEPPVVVEVGAGPGSAPMFFVRDNGVGIEPEDLGRIFQPLERADRSGLNAGGTGMGLALAKRVVDRHGGRIWPESTPGLGTTIWFTLSEHGDEAD